MSWIADGDLGVSASTLQLSEATQVGDGNLWLLSECAPALD
jgi:hypothetical protein